MPRKLLTPLVILLAAVAGVVASEAASGAERAGLAELIGQRLVVPMDGTAPSRALLARIARGEVGGVILFGWNVRSPAQVRAVAASLDAAARSAGRPAPLLMVDQEGGPTRRFRWLPPGLSAEALGERSIPFVRASGAATGEGLRSLAIDIDLAPVADTPRVAGSFLVARERAFSVNPERVASRAAAFARGLGQAGVHATAKHFPGLGGARANTDHAPVTVYGGPGALRADLVPFRRLIAAGVPVVMFSSAVYPAYDPLPAVWSPRLHALLRDDLGFDGVTITDALEPLARTRRVSLSSAALRAAAAGVDLLLFAGSEASTAQVHAALVRAAQRGELDRAGLVASAARIDALRR